MNQPKTLYLIGGPTASGKSLLALDLAKHQQGTIINGDSLQVYKELPILTNHPSAEEQKQAPHHLFGIMDGNQPYTVTKWLYAVETILHSDRNPIIVGGTGFYLSALLHGLSPIPDIPEATQQAVRQLYQGNPTTFYTHLLQLDPLLEGHIRPSDPQRQMRAMEVFLATGRSLISWQQEPRFVPLADWRKVVIILRPPKPTLDLIIDHRLRRMVEAGALEEVKALMQKGYPINIPIYHAIGAKQLQAYLEGQDSWEGALEKIRFATARYAKRQLTWFRHQLTATIALEEVYQTSQEAVIKEIIRA